ncbi:MAG: hypothetical protein ACLR4Z_05255 [Butyricicoccaceae bacterium]
MSSSAHRPMQAGSRTRFRPTCASILHGSGSPAVALVTYGNRAYENALAELFRVLTDGGMKPAAGAVCVCQHSIARALAVGRPNEEDCAEVRRFAAEAAERIQADEIVLSPAVPGDADSSYYVPTGTSGKPAKFLKSAPQTDPEKCDGCGWRGTLSDGLDQQQRSVCCFRYLHQVPGLHSRLPEGRKIFRRRTVSLHARMLEQKFAGIHKENEFYL